jgi:multidrug resistance efflux pump
MSYINRALSGAALTLVTIGLVGAAGWQLYASVSSSESRKRPPARERSYAVDVGTLALTSVTPKVIAYGQVQTWNSLEVRAPAAGPITEISPNFRDGLAVQAGELLFRIDPDNAERRVIDAKAALAQAKYELSEATLNRAHVDAELASARGQTAVRQRDLKRKQALGRKRLITSEVLNAAQLALSTSKQSEIAKQTAVLTAKGRIDKAHADVERAELALKDVEQSLGETSYRAPFAGRLTDVAATLGRRLSQNEKVAALIDPKALEVSFLVRNSDFGHLLDKTNGHKLLPLPVKVSLDLAGTSVVVDGTLDRTAAVAASQSGRTVYAKLNAGQASVLRPGDFVSITIDEPKLANVAVIPTAAATNDGRILLVGNNGRLTQHQAKILRRQGENLIVDSVPLGRQFVRLYLPFLAPGVKVKPRQMKPREVMPASKPAIASKPVKTQSVVADGVAIDAAKRAQLVKLVKASRRMPEDRRATILKELTKPKPSKAVVDRLERRLARRARRSRS